MSEIIVTGEVHRIPSEPSSKGPTPVRPAVFWGGILVFAALAALWIADPFGNLGHSRNPSVLVMDARVLLDAKAAQVSTLALADPTAAERETAQFVERLKAELRKYGDAGYVVLNAGYVAHWPEAVDITARLASDMGIELAAAKASAPAPVPSPSVAPAPAPAKPVPGVQGSAQSPPPQKGAERP